VLRHRAHRPRVRIAVSHGALLRFADQAPPAILSRSTPCSVLVHCSRKLRPPEHPQARAQEWRFLRPRRRSRRDVLLSKARTVQQHPVLGRHGHHRSTRCGTPRRSTRRARYDPRTRVCWLAVLALPVPQRAASRTREQTIPRSTGGREPGRPSGGRGRRLSGRNAWRSRLSTHVRSPGLPRRERDRPSRFPTLSTLSERIPLPNKILT